MKLLHGIRVLDFGRFIAGPYCGALLADHGADVIRIERREGGEDRFMPPVMPSGEGGMFVQLNRGKRCLTLDIAHPRGREIIHQLVRSSDVVIVNLPPPTLAKLGLDYDTLSAINPRIVVAAGTGFGSTGPWSDRAGFDSVGQAMSGAMYMTGHPDAPSRAHANYVDFSTAMSLAWGTLAALWAREKTGRGQLVQASLLRSALVHTNGVLIEQALLKKDRVPQGNRGYTTAPVDLFRTQNGWLTVQSVGQVMFDRWTEVVGRTDLKADPRFATDTLRGDHSAEISGIMSDWCAQRTLEQVMAALDAARIPCAPVLTPQEALEHPQIVGSGLLRDMDFPSLDRPFPLVPHPVEMSETEITLQRAPLLGEHTDEVLRELGLDDAAIATLRADGIV